MPRLKKRKIKEPFVPFMLKLEAAILKAGYKDIKSFVNEHIYQGKPLTKLADVIKERFGIEIYWLTAVKRLKKYVPKTYNIHTRNHFRRKAAAGRTSGEEKAGVTYFINDKIKKGWDSKKIARALKMNPSDARRTLKNYYPGIDWKGTTIFPDMSNFGMKSTVKYYKWYEKAKAIGFESVPEAIEYLIVEKKLSRLEIAFIFGTTSKALRNRMLKCEYLRERFYK